MNRGRLRVLLGAAPGVGKTYAMLEEGKRMSDDGKDVVIGFVEPHDRATTAAMVERLEVIPRAVVRSGGVELRGNGRDGRTGPAPRRRAGG